MDESDLQATELVRSAATSAVPVALSLVGVFLICGVSDPLGFYFVTGVALWVAIAVGGSIGAFRAQRSHFRTGLKGATLTLLITTLFLIALGWDLLLASLLIGLGIPSAAIGAGLGAWLRHLDSRSAQRWAERRNAQIR